MRYRTFTRTWWLDKACTKPGAGRKHFTGHFYATEEEAFPPREPMTWLDRLVIVGTLIGSGGFLYMLARVIFG